ncbi:hypothetical protein [Novosphingobium taihuense]|uniref:Uncharacterized protein n=1 Tax=Novosphingobium taihuense TaxID=260085 RepID=A0A7W7ADT5_9SPHN|nr:hypothetical protein [Novosphingobium taihuense]MBB4615189.1 hypothetical protein [Novosphingobium taihuense]
MVIEAPREPANASANISSEMVEIVGRRVPAQSLFCRSGATHDDRPAISLRVRESFAAYFAADFAAAMTEHRHENDERSADTAA